MTGLALTIVAFASCATAKTKAQDIESVVARVSERLGKQPFAIGPVSGELQKFRMVTAKGASRDLGRAIGMMGIALVFGVELRGFVHLAELLQDFGRVTHLQAIHTAIQPPASAKPAGGPVRDPEANNLVPALRVHYADVL